MLRGGSYLEDDVWAFANARRKFRRPKLRLKGVGFRVALDEPKEQP